MGTDIHIYPEYYKDGSWHVAGDFIIDDEWFDGIYDTMTDDEMKKYKLDNNLPEDTDLYEYFESLKEIPEEFKNHPQINRFHNFDSKFGSRNGELFALFGLGSYPQSFMIKGKPDDISIEVNRHDLRTESDNHSHSFLTVKELKTVNLNYFHIDGYLQELKRNDERLNRDLEFSKHFRDFSNYYFMAVTGLYDSLITYNFIANAKYSVKFEKWFYDVFEYLKEYGSDENTRIVFWFDN